MALRTRMTAEQLFRYQPDNKDTELIRGRMIVREPPRLAHGLYAGKLFLMVATYVNAHDLGSVTPQDTGFIVERGPDTVLAPDLSFTRRERFNPDTPSGGVSVIPDLVAEILSRSDRRARVVRKMERWRSLGVQVGWMIEPKPRVASVFLADGSVLAVPSDGVLIGSSALPGFSCALAEVFVT